LLATCCHVNLKSTKTPFQTENETHQLYLLIIAVVAEPVTWSGSLKIQNGPSLFKTNRNHKTFQNQFFTANQIQHSIKPVLYTADELRYSIHYQIKANPKEEAFALYVSGSSTLDSITSGGKFNRPSFLNKLRNFHLSDRLLFLDQNLKIGNLAAAGNRTRLQRRPTMTTFFSVNIYLPQEYPKWIRIYLVSWAILADL
jgi:hypothetical protein